MMQHMFSNELFTDKQYGFINGRSAALQLLRIMDEWTECLDNGFDIDVVYMDYQKAFDTVPPSSPNIKDQSLWIYTKHSIVA